MSNFRKQALLALCRVLRQGQTVLKYDCSLADDHKASKPICNTICSLFKEHIRQIYSKQTENRGWTL